MLIKNSCVCGQRGVCFTILLIRNDDQFDYINKCYLCVELLGIKIRTTARDISIYVFIACLYVCVCVCVCDYKLLCLMNDCTQAGKLLQRLLLLFLLLLWLLLFLVVVAVIVGVALYAYLPYLWQPSSHLTQSIFLLFLCLFLLVLVLVLVLVVVDVI